MRNLQYEDLRTLRTKINMELFDTNFADEELVKLSFQLNKTIDKYEYNEMSVTDRNAEEIRFSLINITKLLNRSVHHE